MPAVKGRWALELTGYERAGALEEYSATIYFKKEKEARNFLGEVRKIYAGWCKLNVWLIPPKDQGRKEKLL